MKNNLERYRGKAGYSLTDLAKKLNISPQRLFYIEHHNLSVDMAKQIESILNVNMFSLMGASILRTQPRTQEEKDILIDIINKIEV